MSPAGTKRTCWGGLTMSAPDPTETLVLAKQYSFNLPYPVFGQASRAETYGIRTPSSADAEVQSQRHSTINRTLFNKSAASSEGTPRSSR
jgi:hypothetical protein